MQLLTVLIISDNVHRTTSPLLYICKPVYPLTFISTECSSRYLAWRTVFDSMLHQATLPKQTSLHWLTVVRRGSWYPTIHYVMTLKQLPQALFWSVLQETCTDCTSQWTNVMTPSDPVRPSHCRYCCCSLHGDICQGTAVSGEGGFQVHKAIYLFELYHIESMPGDFFPL